MYACCHGCNLRCNPCFRPPSLTHRQHERLRMIDDHRWLQRCTKKICSRCTKEDDSKHLCSCSCRRNQNLVEALSYLFRCPIYYMLSSLFKLAYQQIQPMKRFARDRKWDVMLHVKAPYTEFNDLEIYDSMYDRCGVHIDPLDFNNISKVVRMMFLNSILSLDQRKCLIGMLESLNERAIYRVNLERLLETLKNVSLKELVCSILDQDRQAASFYNAQMCKELCALYQRVTTTDKNMIIKRRKYRKLKKSDKDLELSKKPVRKMANTQLYCVRKPTEPEGSPRATGTPGVGNRHDRYSKTGASNTKVGNIPGMGVSTHQEKARNRLNRVITLKTASEKSDTRRLSRGSRITGLSRRRQKAEVTGPGMRMQDFIVVVS
ncbi:uncharacterized protein Dwil_GK27915 [Drosophila willistoni]|uniref:Uncharacterized protein n=1 Tax=Drosophila willistoni TaxID=7260 RepID=A0A0Q9WZC6_DROWI|nr:uncharacterized protein Dwil_GK27915 [Drosophila willistoni]